MKKVTILALENASSATITVPLDVFCLSSLFWKQLRREQDDEPFFDVEVVTLDGKPVRCLNQITLVPNKSVDEVESTDLIMIPVLSDNFEKVIDNHNCLIPKLKHFHQQGTTICAEGTGVFLLAETGLLNGKAATTHWLYVNKLVAMFPEIHIKPARLITDEGNLICSGGNACTDMPMYLMEKYCGHDFALQAMKYFVSEPWRISQVLYSIFDFQKGHNDQQILAVQEWIEAHYAQQICIEQLTRVAGMSSRSLHRRFKTVTGDTPLVYLQRFRVEMAKRAFETSFSNVEEVAYQVGYEDRNFFRRVFKKYTKQSPHDYRKKFQDRS